MRGERGESQLRYQPHDATKIGLPVRPFLYTLDQISVLVDIDEAQLRSQHVHYEGRSVGAATRRRMLARNIAAAEEKPDYRIAEREFIRWLRFKGFKYYERGVVTH